MRDVLQSFAHVRPAGDGFLARCPAHDDARSSLSIGRGADGKWLLRCHAGCGSDAIVAAAGLSVADLFPEHATTSCNLPGPARRVVAYYDYFDEGGALLYQVCRFDPKDFRQRRPNGWNIAGVRRVLYRLPELQGQTLVYIAEGEQAAETLRGLGLVATTNAGGAGKWRTEYTRQLTAATVERVIILPDHDEPGRAHARTVAESCHAAGLHVRVVDLPGLSTKGADITDWITAATRSTTC